LPVTDSQEFSVGERDRRWQAVRTNAATAELDCVFVPLCVDGRNLNLSLEQSMGTQSDGRYLTHMDQASVVLPSDGRQPIVITESGQGNKWFPESRVARGDWGRAMAEALLDLGMESARIGVTGLGRGRVTHGRAVNGVVNHTSYAEVQRRLPNATFVDGNDAVGFARFVKSDEEIAYLEKGASIAVAGIERMIEVARPGVPLAAVYAAVMERMLELGSAYYPLAIFASPLGTRGPRYENPPANVILQAGSLITHETDAVWAGLIAQELQPILLGQIPDEWRRVADLQRDLFYAGMNFMRPGTALGDLIDFVNGFGATRGGESLILMHGRGYGNDGPLLTPTDRGSTDLRDLRLEAGNVWVWKPIAYSADQSIEVSFGGCVAVTEEGGRQLVPRDPGIVSIA
jgi:Xaa-Pro aminopeptidase